MLLPNNSAVPRRIARTPTVSIGSPLNLLMNNAMLFEMRTESAAIPLDTNRADRSVTPSSRMDCALCCQMQRQGSPVDCGFLVRGCIC